jgi:hypothetical protein
MISFNCRDFAVTERREKTLINLLRFILCYLSIAMIIFFNLRIYIWLSVCWTGWVLIECRWVRWLRLENNICILSLLLAGVFHFYFNFEVCCTFHYHILLCRFLWFILLLINLVIILVNQYFCFLYLRPILFQLIFILARVYILFMHRALI